MEEDIFAQRSHKEQLKFLMNRAQKILQKPGRLRMGESIKRISKLLKHLDHFTDIQDNYQQFQDQFERSVFELSKLVQLKIIKKNEFVFHMGQISDYVYFVLEGTVVVLIPKSGVEIMQEKRIQIQIQNLEEELADEQKFPNLEHKTEKHPKRIAHLQSILKSHYSDEEVDQLLYKNEHSRKYVGSSGMCNYKCVQYVSDGNSFGELGLLYNAQRKGSVLGFEEETYLLAIKTTDYRKVFSKYITQINFLTFMINNQLSDGSFSTQIIYDFSQFFRFKRMDFSRQIYGYGQQNETWYFIQKGRVKYMNIINNREELKDHINAGNQDLERKDLHEVYNKHATVRPKDFPQNEREVLSIGENEIFGHEQAWGEQRNFAVYVISEETEIYAIEIKDARSSENFEFIVDQIITNGTFLRERLEERIRDIKENKEVMKMAIRTKQDDLTVDKKLKIKSLIERRDINIKGAFRHFLNMHKKEEDIRDDESQIIQHNEIETIDNKNLKKLGRKFPSQLITSGMTTLLKDLMSSGDINKVVQNEQKIFSKFPIPMNIYSDQDIEKIFNKNLKKKLNPFKIQKIQKLKSEIERDHERHGTEVSVLDQALKTSIQLGIESENQRNSQSLRKSSFVEVLQELKDQNQITAIGGDNSISGSLDTIILQKYMKKQERKSKMRFEASISQRISTFESPSQRQKHEIVRSASIGELKKSKARQKLNKSQANESTFLTNHDSLKIDEIFEFNPMDSQKPVEINLNQEKSLIRRIFQKHNQNPSSTNLLTEQQSVRTDRASIATIDPQDFQIEQKNPTLTLPKISISQTQLSKSPPKYRPEVLHQRNHAVNIRKLDFRNKDEINLFDLLPKTDRIEQSTSTDVHIYFEKKQQIL